MARSHFWHYLQNEEGQPVAGAEISVYLAGSSIPASVYTSESGGTMVSTTPQVLTRDDGFFEFWIADESEPGGYSGYKFKIAWSKRGVIDNGEVDNVEVVIPSKEVDEDDAYDTSKNKMVSNALAYSWNNRAKKYTFTVNEDDWIEEYGNYYYDCVHGFENKYPLVMVYEDDALVMSTWAFFAAVVNNSTVRVYRTTDKKCFITVIG